jgi:heme-degrading monooxygenase HmoA
MYARIVNITGAKDIDDGIRMLRDQLPSALKDQKGFRGMAVSADRAGGILGVLTLWDTEADRDASWDALAARRQETQDLIGGEMNTATYEELLAEAGDAPPAPGSALLLWPVSMEPARVDENLAFFRSEVLPRIKASQGFQQVRLLMNRQTGQGVGGTVWATEDAMRAHAADAQARRQASVDRGVRFGEMRYREIVFADF